MTVEILLPVWNGTPFLGELLESLRSQTHEDWILRVRDDGSTDHTREVLVHAAEQDGRIRIEANDAGRLGACGSFAWLLESASGDPDYVMFCDQDDFWFPEKIEKTVAAMHKAEQESGGAMPILVHTDLTVTDAGLNPIDESFWRYSGLRPKRTKLNQLLMQNPATGCTVMINRALRELALPIPFEAVMHDWWLALVASGFGRIVHISEPTVFYRQHGGNDTGAQRYSPIRGIPHDLTTAGFGRLKEDLRRTTGQAAAFLRQYGDRMDPSTHRLVSRYADILSCGPVSRRARLLELGTLKHGFARNLGLVLRA